MQQSGIIPDIVSYSETFREACEKSGRWELLKSNRERSVKPNTMTYSVAFEAVKPFETVFNTHNHGKTFILPACITTVTNQEDTIACDLHGMPLSTACMLVSGILIASAGQTRENQRDLVFIVRRGVHSEREKEPVLEQKIQRFLRNNSGPSVSKDVARYEGYLLIAKANVLNWLKSDDDDRFKRLVSIPQSFLLAEPDPRRKKTPRSLKLVESGRIENCVRKAERS